MTNEYRDVLDAAIGTPPPSTVDLDEIVRTNRRVVGFRRGLAAGSAVTATALVIGAAFVLPGLRQDAAHRTEVPAASATASGSTAGQNASVEEEQTVQRLSAVLDVAMRRVAPGTTVVRAPDGPPPSLRFIHTSVIPSGRDGAAYLAGAPVRTGADTGGFWIAVTKADGSPATSCEPGRLPAGTTKCRVSTGPHGETVVRIEARRQAAGHPDWVSYRVTVTKPDGTQVTADASNSVAVVTVYGTKVTVTPGVPGPNVLPPLTVEQVTALALDPGFVLHP